MDSNARASLQKLYKASVRPLVPDWLALAIQYRRYHGRLPNLIRPTTFTEKIVWRAAFDRRPLLAQISCKALAREYVVARLGPEAVPRLYCSTTQPSQLPFKELPDRFVVKPTHASGWVAIVPDKSRIDEGALIRRCDEWLSQNYYTLSREWIYKNAKPRIHVEEFIDDGRSTAPYDYKLYVFHGAVVMIQVDAARFTAHRRALYTPTWHRLDVEMACKPIVGPAPRPPDLDGMVAAAERLARDFDFLRVDCLCTANRFYVNELTATPCRGMGAFEPIAFDHYLGARWRTKSDARP